MMNKATLQYKEHNFHGVYGVLKTVIVFLWSCTATVRKCTMEF